MTYAATRLKPAALRELLNLQNEGQSHQRAFTLAIGYVMGRSLSIPAEYTDDFAGYFRFNHQVELSSRLSTLNELIPFNTNQAMEDVRNFMSFRNSQRQPDRIPLALNKDNALVDFFGISKFFPKEVIEIISTKGDQLTRLISQLTPIMEDLVVSVVGVGEEVPDLSDKNS